MEHFQREVGALVVAVDGMLSPAQRAKGLAHLENPLETLWEPAEV